MISKLVPMPPSRRRVLRLGGTAIVGGLAGCLARDSPGTPTGAHTPTTTDRDSTTSPTCQTPTPRRVPGITLHNETNERVTATIIIKRKSDQTSASFYEDRHTVGPGEHAAAYDIFPDRDVYEITVELDDGTTTSADVEAEPTRYGEVAIRIEANDSIEIGWLHVVPPESATPCP